MLRLHRGREAEAVAVALPQTAEHRRHPGPVAGVEESHLLMAELPLRRGPAVADSRQTVARHLRHGREGVECSSNSLESLFA